MSRFFVPHGLTQQDAYAELQYAWGNGLAARVLVQAERWAAPLLAPTAQKNVPGCGKEYVTAPKFCAECGSKM